MNLGWTARPAAQRRPSQDAPDVFATYAPFFLERLLRLCVMRRWPRLSPLERRLVDHALYSTYWDCVDVGAGEEAVHLNDAAQQVMGNVAPARGDGGRRS